MKIALINGSPKTNRSASGTLLADLQKYITGINTAPESLKPEIAEYSCNIPAISDKIIVELQNTAVLVFACPLYVDGIPAHLLSCLMQLESANWKNHSIHVHGIVNCGFYEGIQAEPALCVLQNWCAKTGLIWGGGIGVGGGLCRCRPWKTVTVQKHRLKKRFARWQTQSARTEHRKTSMYQLPFQDFSTGWRHRWDGARW